MASRIIGRKPCLLGCGFESAHVRESEKCLYHYCPSCGVNGPHARTEQQKDLMRKGMRPEGAPAPAPEPVPPEPTPAPTPTRKAAKPPEPEPEGDPVPEPEPDPTPTPSASKSWRRGIF